MTGKVHSMYRDGLSPALVRTCDELQEDLLTAIEKACAEGMPLVMVIGMMKLIELEVIEASYAGEGEQ